MDPEKQKQLWLATCRKKIALVVVNSRRISLRDLKRRTHYSREPRGLEGEAVACWFQALEELEKRKVLRLMSDTGEAIRADDWEFKGRQWVVSP